MIPVVDYGSIFYTGTSVTTDKSLESIQRLFIRRLYKRIYKVNTPPTSYKERLLVFKLPTLKSRYISHPKVPGFIKIFVLPTIRTF